MGVSVFVVHIDFTNNIDFLTLGENSNTSVVNSLWKDMWTMRVPHKIRLFAWCACRNGLPSFQNLQRKNINLDSNCVFSEAPVEDLTMLLFIVQNSADGGWFSSLS